MKIGSFFLSFSSLNTFIGSVVYLTEMMMLGEYSASDDDRQKTSTTNEEKGNDE
jgi:hypothetical protein